ncbi:MAG: YfbU family protein [Candidatus Omnitrophota bacterium]
MELTKSERLILANQFEILAYLNSSDSKKELCLEKKKIVEKGYLREFEELFMSIEENQMTVEEYQEIQDILTMFNDIQWSCENLEDKADINEDAIVFKGFDFSFEAEQYCYAEFLLSKARETNKFLPKRSADMNSHAPKLNRYKEMLLAWKAISDKEPKHLNAEQIKLLLA